MRAKQRSDRDLGTVHALNYFACPKFLEETKKEKEEREKKKEKVEEKEEEKRILRNKKRTRDRSTLKDPISLQQRGW